MTRATQHASGNTVHDPLRNTINITWSYFASSPLKRASFLIMMDIALFDGKELNPPVASKRCVVLGITDPIKHVF